MEESEQECELCGEPIKQHGALHLWDEIGEFVVDKEGVPKGRATFEEQASRNWPTHKVGEHVIAHAQCGLDRGLPLA